MKLTKRNKIYLILFFPYILLLYKALNISIVEKSQSSYIVLSMTCLTVLTALVFVFKTIKNNYNRKEDC